MRRGVEKNGIAVHVKKTQHDTNWVEEVLKSETQYWRRIVDEAICCYTYYKIYIVLSPC